VKQVFGYIRVSTKKQTQGVSLDEQRDAIIRFAAREGLAITAWFEEHLTAAKRGRPKFTDMLRRLRLGEAQGVVIHKVDRSARNLDDWNDIAHLLDEGFQVYIANDNLDLRSRGGRLSADIQAVVAADFIRNNREEARKGFYGRLKQGLYPLPAPIGYLDRGKGNPKILDPVRAPLVRKVFDLYAAGDHSLRSLTSLLPNLGLLNRGSKPLSKDGVWVMLTNPFYTGLVRLKSTGETFHGVHEPLVPPSLFNRVQDLLNGKANGRLRKHDHLFRRRFVCGSCGYAMSASLKKGHVYYRCYQTNCPVTSSVREEKIDRAVRRRLCTAGLPAAVFQTVHSILAVRKTRAHEEQQIMLAALRATSGKIDSRLAALTDAFIDGTIERDLFLTRKESLLKERVAIASQARALERDATAKYSAAAKFFELAQRPDNQYNDGDFEEKRRLLDKLTCDRRVAAGNVEISLAPPFKQLSETAKLQNGAPHQDIIATANTLIDIVLSWLESDAAQSPQRPHVHFNHVFRESQR
jgi:DNA invertase Pin-like site-specific DNA recombinase